MGLTSALKSILKKSPNTNGAATGAAAASATTKKTLHWASDVVDNAPSSKRASSKKAKVATAAGTTTNIKEEENVGSSVFQRTKHDEEGEKKTKATPPCSFCGKNPSCIRMKASWKGKDKKQSLCLLHYYTTSAVHADDHHVKILDAKLLEAQLHGGNSNGDTTIHKNNKLNVQDLFAEAYVQLQQELAQESLNISMANTKNSASDSSSKQQKTTKKKMNNDPLAIIHDLNRNNKKKRKAPPPTPSSSTLQSGSNNKVLQGGFLKPVPVPERLRKTQEQQAKWQAEQLARINRAKAGGAAATSKRREPTRKSVWSTVMDKGNNSNDNPSQQPRKKKRPSLNRIIEEIDLTTVDDVTCSSCGSSIVVDVGNITSRNADVRKGEIWGSGDRSDEVVMRYRCNQCGKTWQETT